MAHDFLILVLHLYGNIKLRNFQTKVPIDKKVVRLDVPVSDTELVNMRETLDRALANLIDLSIKWIVGDDLEVISDGAFIYDLGPIPTAHYKITLDGKRLDKMNATQKENHIR